jgi:hypothetical protein
MGHSAKDMSDHYDRVRDDVVFRRDVAKSLSVGFDLPKALNPKRTKRKKTPKWALLRLLGVRKNWR